MHHGTEHGDSNQQSEDAMKNSLLAWNKLSSSGHRPAATEGHSLTSEGSKIFMFGGLDQSFGRKNTTYMMDLSSSTSGQWSILNCVGERPACRAYHAACQHHNFLIISGGETTYSQSEPAHNTVCVGYNIAWARKMPVVTHLENLKQHHEAENDMRIKSKTSFSLDAVQSDAVLTEGDESNERRRFCCLDDLWVLDMSTQVLSWRRVQTYLSPLSRKGHSLVITHLALRDTSGVQIEEPQDYLLLFGGLSTNRMAYGSSVHICRLRDVLCADTSVYWRLLECHGDLPPPRFLHSATLLHSDVTREGAMPNYLAVFGGINSQSSRYALSDLFLLNLESLVWEHVEEADGLEPPRIFGHVAFATPPPMHSADTRSEVDKTGSNLSVNHGAACQLVIFGGGTHPAKSCETCLGSLFCFGMCNRWLRSTTI